MRTYLSAEVEEYEEVNSNVKLCIYRNKEDKGNCFQRIVAEIPEVPRGQAESVVEAFNKYIPGFNGTIALFDFLNRVKQGLN